MLLAAATIIAISLAVIVITQNRLAFLDWHGQRGLSFFSIGFARTQTTLLSKTAAANLSKFAAM